MLYNSSIWAIDRTLLCGTAPDMSGPESNGNEGVFRIPRSSNTTGDSPSDCFVETLWGFTPLQRNSWCILQPQWTGSPQLWLNVFSAFYDIVWRKVDKMTLDTKDLSLESNPWKFTKLFAQMWHKAIWKGHPMRLELTRVGLLVELANHYTTRGASRVQSMAHIELFDF